MQVRHYRFGLPCLGLVVIVLSATQFLGADDVAVQEPIVIAASREGELAKAGIKVPEGVEVQLYAAEPMLANPVAFGFDEQGRVYVCETFRQQQGVEDNRGHMNWLEDDLAARSVADRVAFFRKHLSETVADYAKQQDRIRRLEDTNGDGIADLDTVFAAPFHAIEDGTGAGVLAHNGDIYYTNIPKLYRLRDADGDGVAEERTTLADGFGVRVAFRGHDMHGLTIGPDGRLYFSIGDRGYNVTSAEGGRLVRPDTGAVFRCELDGSQLEVFAYGLRNPQELAFDDYGNLFTGDNNSDSGDQARWVHVVQGSDTGWRMYFQYLPDRGPWNRERMWYPYRSDDETTSVQPAYIVPPVTNIADGPSGLVYYPGVGLPKRYDGHFFLADFRGSTSRSGIRSFALEPRGATFRVVDEHWFIENLLATDVDFGYDGKLYASDWVDGWNGPGKGRIYTFAATAERDAIKVAGTAELFSVGFAERPAAELAMLLGHRDRRVRQASQLALASGNQVETLAQIAQASGATLPRVHAIWGLWQVGRQATDNSIANVLRPLAADADAEVRAQVCRVLGDLRAAESLEILRRAIQAGTPRERHFAAIAIGRVPGEGQVARTLEALIELLAANNDHDPVIRHAAVMGIVGQGRPADWIKHEGHSSAAVQRGIVLALRRAHSGEIARFLERSDSSVATEAARAIHDEPIAAALPALAGLADHARADLPDALLRRVLNANYRLGGPAHAQAAADIAISEEHSEALRQEAVFALVHWDQPPNLDRVTNEYRPLPRRSLETARPSIERTAFLLLSESGSLRAGGIELIGRYRIDGLVDELLTIASSNDEPANIRASALTALLSFDTPQLATALQAAADSDVPELRMAAHAGLATTRPNEATEALRSALSAERSTQNERQQAIRLLAGLAHTDADALLAEWLDQLRSQPDAVPAAIQLDLLTAGEQRGTESLKSLVAAIEQTRSPDDLLAAYRVCLQGGDVGRGREIFFGNAAASCRRCHKVEGEGSDVGPDLSGVGKINPREYLLESIVHPNAKIAKGFETVVFVMDDGRLYTGLLKGEDDDSYQLMSAQGELLRVEKSGIEERAAGKSGMPEDAVKALSKADLRDLVQYLSTLQTPAAGAAAHGEDHK